MFVCLAFATDTRGENISFLKLTAVLNAETSARFIFPSFDLVKPQYVGELVKRRCDVFYQP